MQAAVAGCLPVAGQPVDGGVKSNGAIPTSAVCTLDVRGGLYFCGIAGSPCASDSNCDNGHCVAGTCTGGYTTPCTLDSQCTGNLYCLTNLEQCGGCAADGGVDCTAIPGVESVGCVDGVCEIWSCAEGFSWDGKTAECVQKRE
ncbi:hypothetical protein MNV49_005835 [Pseudohyphozyma bogoriensis]|nr:hypothetical protein MNV49_005835 [Pseudohyphozyma bogoriensis]